jgi:hypothetical protein
MNKTTSPARPADAVKIFRDKNGNVTKVPSVEHVPPDVTACIFWMKNRDPQHWRDSPHRCQGR